MDRLLLTHRRRINAIIWGLTLVLVPMGSAHAWSINIAAASRRVFLHVGNGSYDANNGTINRVLTTIPAPVLGNGVPQVMTTNSTQSRSLYDNYLTCPNPGSQILIGASYRRNNRNSPPSVALMVSSPAHLENANGDTIPFSEISWTVSAAGSSSPNVIAAGTFNGGTQTLATVPANRYIENCHTFSFANTAVRAAGVYNGRVTYTMSIP